MKDRSIPILLIGIAVVGLFIVIQETWRAQKPVRQYQQKAVFELHPDALTSLHFKTADTLVDCVKENGIWMVGNADKGMGRADIIRIHELVRGLNALGKGTTISQDELELRGLSLSDYGFDPPVLEIVAVDNRGRHVWEVGRDTPSGLEVYVREADAEEIYTILHDLWDVVPSEPADLRNRTLFPGELAAIRRLEIRGSSVGFVRVVKEGSVTWLIQQPLETPADPLEVLSYLDALRNVRIEDFIAENVSDLSAYGLQGETKQISLGYSEGSSSTLILGDPIPNRSGLLYARRADDTSVFALKVDILNFFELPNNAFRDARLITLSRDTINSIQIRRGDQQLMLSESGSGSWEVKSPVVWDADADAVFNLIDLWSKAVVTEYDISVTAVSPEWMLEFSSAESAATNRIEVLAGGERQDGLLVRLNNEPDVMQINLPMVPDSIIDPLVYKDRYVWSLSRSDVNKLILEKDDGARQIVERDAGGNFVALQASGNEQVDALAVEQIINLLCALDTSEYIAYNPRSLDIYGLTDPDIELYVGLSDTNQLGRVLLIGRETSEGFYSMVKGRDVVFYLDKPTVESLSTDLVVRQGASVQVAE
jgi:hypothetical protein